MHWSRHAHEVSLDEFVIRQQADTPRRKWQEQNCSRRDLGVFLFFHNYYLSLSLPFFSPAHSSSPSLSLAISCFQSISFFFFLYISRSLFFLFFCPLILLFCLFICSSFPHLFLSFLPPLLSYFFLLFSNHSYFTFFCPPPCLCLYHT